LDQSLDRLFKPSRGNSPTGRVLKPLNHDKTVDLAVEVSVEERRIVGERHTSVRLAIGPQQIMVREDALAAEHVAVTGRDQANGANAVEQVLTQCQPIGIGRSWAFALDVNIAWIVHVTAKTGMCFEPAAVGQIHRLGAE